MLNLNHIFTSKWTITVFTIGLLMLNFSTFAQQTKYTNPILQTAVVKQVGTKGDKMLLQLQLDNENGEKFNVSIKDESDNTLFSEVYSDKKFSKSFRLEEPGNVTVTIKTLKDKETQAFKVVTSTRVLRDISVSKL